MEDGDPGSEFCRILGNWCRNTALTTANDFKATVDDAIADGVGNHNRSDGIKAGKFGLERLVRFSATVIRHRDTTPEDLVIIQEELGEWYELGVQLGDALNWYATHPVL